MSLQLFIFIEVILFGLVLGSFLNVCIHRLPKNKTLGGRSACPKCQKQIAWYDNVPVFSYLILGGKCRHCKTAISFRYPFVELLTGFVSMLVYWRAGNLPEYFLWFLLFGAPLVVVTFIDFDEQIIPDIISLPGIPIGVLVHLFGSWPMWKESLIDSGLGILVGGGSLLLISQLYYIIRKREGLGGGDVKLCAAFGAFLGWKPMVFIFMISSVLALLYAVVSLIFSRNKEEGPMIIPYGPFLSAAAFIYYLYGTEIVLFYFSLIGVQSPVRPF